MRVGRTRRQACCFVAPLYICRCCRAPLLIPLLIASRTVPTVARSSPHGKASGSERYRLLHTCPPEGVRVLRARKSHPTVPHFPHSLTCLKGTYVLPSLRRCRGVLWFVRVLCTPRSEMRESTSQGLGGGGYDAVEIGMSVWTRLARIDLRD